VLDVGCGTGDFARALAGAGASVVAIDLSPRVIEEARRRTFGLPALTFRVAAVEDLSLEPASLDLITSVTVLQHLADDRLDAALARFSVALKAGGHALALEIAPAVPRRDDRTPHVHVRSHDEWVRRFAAHGLALRAAVSYPQLAVILLNRIGRARGMAPRAGEEAWTRRGLRRIAYRGILAASWLFDRILTVPPPAALALYRIFLFRRSA
jgi:SAM-dependent methyltransferase